MLAHLAQRDAFRQLSAHQFRRGGGEQDLVAVRGGHDPRCAIQRRAEIIAIPKFRHAGVQAHPHSLARPAVGRQTRAGSGFEASPPRRLQGALCGEARRERIRSSGEDCIHTVARALDDASAGRLDRVTQQPVVARERDLHRVGISAPTTLCCPRCP